MAKVKQYYNIKYPITANNQDGLFIDLNENINDNVLSRILYVILTEKGTRIRKPEFGTDLIKYIFEPNDNTTFDTIKEEVKKAISTYVTEAQINDISVIRDETDDNMILLKVEYGVKIGMNEENKVAVIRL